MPQLRIDKQEGGLPAKSPTEIQYMGVGFPVDIELSTELADQLLKLIGQGARSWLQEFGCFRLIRGKDRRYGSDDYYLYRTPNGHLISHPTHPIL